MVLSLVLALAERAARAGRRESLTRMLTVALLFTVAFLASQVGNWMRMASADALPQQNLYIWGFYTLTCLHALHVLGGLVPLTLVTLRARRDRYTTTDHEGVDLVAMYWHFLAITWVAIGSDSQRDMIDRHRKTAVSCHRPYADIRRATRKRHSSEEKIRIVLEGLRGEESIPKVWAFLFLRHYYVTTAPKFNADPNRTPVYIGSSANLKRSADRTAL